MLIDPTDFQACRTWARMYDPVAGRFITKDPIGFSGGDTNLYRYAENDPVRFIDTLGWTKEDVARAIAFVKRYDPRFVDVTISYSDNPAYDGQARPAILPGGKNEIILNTEFLSVLNDAQLKNLLDTIYHENKHVQDGFFTTLFSSEDRHTQIFSESAQFIGRYGNQFIAESNVCK